MSKKSLIKTNPYLQNSKSYNASLITNVSSSMAIETGENVLSIANKLTEIADTILIVSPPKQKSISQ